MTAGVTELEKVMGWRPQNQRCIDYRRVLKVSAQRMTKGVTKLESAMASDDDDMGVSKGQCQERDVTSSDLCIVTLL